MPARALTRPRSAPASRVVASPRWHSLDVLKGLALWAMVAHHFQKWAGGDVDARFVGFDHLVVTDLAAPLFAVGLGAAAVVVGSRVPDVAHLRSPVWRWTQILLIGLAIDLVTHDLLIEGRGVLPTLAILGLLVTLATFVGVRSPWAWWGIAGLCTVLAVPATRLTGDDPFRLLLHGPFALPVYGVFAASGAAMACHGLGRAERALPLWRAAAGVLVAGLLVGTLGGGVVVPDGLWPPARYPGHLSFTLWGLVASLVIWALARALLPAGGAVSEAVARAGRRTLLVFAAHFAVKVVLDQLGLLGDLDTRAWGLATWAAVIVVCAASTIPRRSPTPS